MVSCCLIHDGLYHNCAYYTDPFLCVLSIKEISENVISKLIGELIINYLLHILVTAGYNVYFRERNSES